MRNRRKWNKKDMYIGSRRKSSNNIISVAISAMFVIVGIMLIIYFTQKNKYKNVFYEGTTINGVDCSLLTVEQAEQLLNDKELEYALKIKFKNDETAEIQGTQIQLEVKNAEAELQNLKKQQNRKLFFSGGEYTVTLTYNDEKLKKKLSKMKQLQTKYMKSKSKIKYDESNRCFNREKYYLDFDEVFEEVSKAVEEKRNHISLEQFYKGPKKDTALEKLNKIAKSVVVYEIPNNKQYVLDIDTLKTWLIRDKKGNIKKNNKVWKQKMEEFVTQLASQVDTLGKTRKFKPTGKDSKISVSGGNYGYILDKEKEVKQLTKDLASHKEVKRKPIYLKEEVSNGKNGLAKSYVEIDITRQKVWVYVDGKLQVETSCVTGCVNKGNGTPSGIFTLTYKQRDAVLKAPLINGKRAYETPVNYWMPFNGGIGLHDATWRSSFGGSIYVNSGSHGCVNLPLDSARRIYDIIDYQMPIIVYKS